MLGISNREFVMQRLFLSTVLLLTFVVAGWAQSPVQRSPSEPQRKADGGNNEYTPDFTPGRVPTQLEIAEVEKEVAAHPDDFQLVRKLGIGHFYQYFGGGLTAAGPKSQKTLERALELKKDDALTTAFLGALASVRGGRAKDAAERKAELQLSFELYQKARMLGPDNIGVLSLAGPAYLALPKPYDGPAMALEVSERIRKLLGPEFKNWSEHGQQRVLYTQGVALVRLGRTVEARACFEEGFQVNETSVEGGMLKAQLEKIK